MQAGAAGAALGQAGGEDVPSTPNPAGKHQNGNLLQWGRKGKECHNLACKEGQAPCKWLQEVLQVVPHSLEAIGKATDHSAFC